MRFRRAAIALVLVASGCGHDSPRVPKRPNLLLVTLDTVRTDRLGAYGYRMGETPRMDRLAEEGLLVRQAVATAPLTLPSHASLLTGLAPPRHGIHDNADYRLPESETTLAEHLRRSGYRTAASVGAAVLSSSLGIAQGFETYDEPAAVEVPRPGAGAVGFVRIAERDARSVTDDALSALDRMADEPFFLWVHYFDPHADYTPPEPWKSRFVERPYDGEIAWVDAQLGRVLDALSSKGLDGRTVVVVTSDHGESLGEHGEKTHGLLVYDSTIRVPWIVRFPGVVPPGVRYGGLVSGIDLVPSVLSLMGLPALPAAQGSDHSRGWSGGAVVETPPAYAESLLGKRAYGWSALRSLRTLDEKFIDAPVPELYRITDDPDEASNLAPSRPDDVARWEASLADTLEEFGRAGFESSHPSTAEEREMLASLGYVGAASGTARGGTGPDPKVMVAAHERYMEAQSLAARGRGGEAESLLEKVLADDPENPAALSLLGSVRFAAGRALSGLASLEDAARRSPGVFENRTNLANAYHASGRLDDAIGEYEAALAIRPTDRPTLHSLGRALLARGRPDRAVEVLRASLGEGASEADVRATLGAALADAGDLAGAERELRAAVTAQPEMAAAWNKLGVVMERSGRDAEAAACYDEALRADPKLADALFNRAKAFLREGRIEDAGRFAERLIVEHPEYDQGWLLAANARAAGGDRAGARQALGVLLGRTGIDPRLERAARETLRKLGA